MCRIEPSVVLMSIYTDVCLIRQASTVAPVTVRQIWFLSVTFSLRPYMTILILRLYSFMKPFSIFLCRFRGNSTKFHRLTSYCSPLQGNVLSSHYIKYIFPPRLHESTNNHKITRNHALSTLQFMPNLSF